ncbi:hypothetical protein [Gorillibacterium massiliense]|uniref:hypothetical protein n=1 Tax=Gorillibacterium massiliense TaxID=1280390 RepID=UPI000694ACAD|nr:hypothetical protein [Gorillibacterium massiliense]
MRLRLFKFVVAIAILSLVASCGKPKIADTSPLNSTSRPSSNYGDTMGMQEYRERLQRFVTDRLSGGDGVFTNFIDTAQRDEVATGHEVLSESAGILLRYYALTGQQELFDEAWANAKRVFTLDSGFSYRYSPKLHKRYSTNAAVDDLRIIRALSEAGAAFGDDRYAEEARSYGQRFYEHNVVKGYLRDFYDDSVHTANNSVTLCYIDFSSLQVLPVPEKSLQKLNANMLNVVRGGYLSDGFPFYKTSYLYETRTYSKGSISTVQSLLTILSLAEIGQQQPASVRYLKDQIGRGALYGQYTEDGKPASDVQSTAIYALAAMIGSVLDDQELYEMSIRRMNQYRVNDGNTPLQGGFGDVTTEQAYSFDNLMALIAYAY